MCSIRCTSQILHARGRATEAVAHRTQKLIFWVRSMGNSIIVSRELKVRQDERIKAAENVFIAHDVYSNGFMNLP